jgi:hypothetical protein
VILNGSRDINFTMDLVVKDVGLFDKLANLNNVPLEISPIVLNIFKDGVVYLYYLHNFDNEVVIVLSAELKKGRHYYALPSLFGKGLKYGRKVYTHPSPAFSISYPKHYKVTAPARDEVLLVKYPISNTPQLGVYVDNKPKDIDLQNIGQRYFAKIIKKHSTYMKMVSSAPNVLSDGTIVSV